MFSFCAVPVNKTAMLIIGGYSQNGALDSVELLDTESGRWEHLERLPHPRWDITLTKVNTKKFMFHNTHLIWHNNTLDISTHFQIWSFLSYDGVSRYRGNISIRRGINWQKCSIFWSQVQTVSNFYYILLNSFPSQYWPLVYIRHKISHPIIISRKLGGIRYQT